MLALTTFKKLSCNRKIIQATNCVFYFIRVLLIDQTSKARFPFLLYFSWADFDRILVIEAPWKSSIHSMTFVDF